MTANIVPSFVIKKMDTINCILIVTAHTVQGGIIFIKNCKEKRLELTRKTEAMDFKIK